MCIKGEDNGRHKTVKYLITYRDSVILNIITSKCAYNSQKELLEICIMRLSS